MEIDKNVLDKLAEADDGLLRDQILMLATALGVSQEKAKSFVSDMPKLKKTVSQLSQQDLNTIASAVGEDKLTQIMSAAKSVTNSDNKTQR